MQQAKGFLDGLVKCLGVGVWSCSLGIQEVVSLREVEQLHGTFGQEILHEGETWLLDELDPDVAVCRLEHGEGAFGAVLGREEECLAR